MSWSRCWTYPTTLDASRTAPLPSSPAPSSTLRLLQMTSGLFDTGFTDLSADRSVNSKMSVEELGSVSEMFSSIGGTDDLLDDLPSSLELDASFNEVFTDLSAFIEQDQMGADLTSVTEVTNVTQITDVISVAPNTDLDLTSEAPMVADTTVAEKPTRKGRKRKAPTENVQLMHHSYSTKKPKVEHVELPTIDRQEVTSTVTPPTKQTKYRERRDKNNIASKRSRETRKQKYSEMEEKAIELEKDNAALKEKVAELERLTQNMKNMLVQRLAQS